MKSIFKLLDSQELTTIINDVLEERCNRCGILMEELFNGYFNFQWVKHWVRNAMPLDIASDDYQYQVIMYGCRDQFLRRI